MGYVECRYAFMRMWQASCGIKCFVMLFPGQNLFGRYEV
jgi:hypothetical protein